MIGKRSPGLTASIGRPWSETFAEAQEWAREHPIPACHVEGGGPRLAELEIAYYMATADAGGPPTLAGVHSFAVQVTLNVAREITPYANMARLQRWLQGAGFQFEGGKVLPPEQSGVFSEKSEGDHA